MDYNQLCRVSYRRAAGTARTPARTIVPQDRTWARTVAAGPHELAVCCVSLLYRVLLKGLVCLLLLSCKRVINTNHPSWPLLLCWFGTCASVETSSVPQDYRWLPCSFCRRRFPADWFPSPLARS